MLEKLPDHSCSYPCLLKLVYLNCANALKEKGACGYLTTVVCVELKGDPCRPASSNAQLKLTFHKEKRQGPKQRGFHEANSKIFLHLTGVSNHVSATF